ncbi:A/G-specific adenine glycosylase [Kineococcus endophyticus]|uniref:A/G-specific adenine glycosylase n=1 Tax=Kineococcus endophyticus TaxID=1181883 RepID=A0ABV3P3B2_9ACTN
MSTAPADAGPDDIHDLDDLHTRVLDWYADHARDLPWRAADRTPWGVLVSEVMLQQTPVARVLPQWLAWMERWPTPSDLADAAPGDAVRAWDRLGYPRRALRRHAAAGAVRAEHGGEVPEDHARLLALPGVGTYTAAAVASFAFGQRHAVVDTNVRRVHARAVTGAAEPAAALTAAEQRLAVALLPEDAPTAARWAVAVMELGALVCTARSPRCDDCPLLDRCAWVLAGRPAHDGPARRGQAWAGTDRQVRGKLLSVLRGSADPVTADELAACWADDRQRARCLDGLVADGLVEPLPDGRFSLPRT